MSVQESKQPYLRRYLIAGNTPVLHYLHIILQRPRAGCSENICVNVVDQSDERPAWSNEPGNCTSSAGKLLKLECNNKLYKSRL